MPRLPKSDGVISPPKNLLRLSKGGLFPGSGIPPELKGAFRFSLALVALCFGLPVAEAAGGVVINEFSATGSKGFTDSDGEESDWIELTNPGDAPIALGGYYLTDDPSDLTKWRLPATDLDAGSFLVLFASGKDRDTPGTELHTNFSLSRTGEHLALVAPDGINVVDEFNPGYPEQISGSSYGRLTGNELGFFDPPTPGTTNGASAFDGLVADTQFSVDRGFYENPFLVEITTETPDAVIHFTTDGSKPGPTHGTVYDGAITISGTTVLRAVALKTGYRSSNVDTHTYLFLDQVLQQPANPPGFPGNWNSIEGDQLSDYEMDPEVIGPIYREAEVKAGLRSLPTVCISTEVDNLFDGDTGIYINAKQRGDVWEREISIEFFDFEHGKDLQVNTGLRMNGNFSRSKIQPKHNMRVVARDEYGPSTIRFELFEDNEVTKFNSLILRGLSGDSWAHARYPHAQYIRDQWFRDAHELMGYEGIGQREVQLYINGLYWGMYHIFERIEDDSMAERFGGEEEDWEVIKDGSSSSVVSIDGGTARWDSLLDIIQAGGLSGAAQYEAVRQELDIDALIDYMVLNFYGGNDDWCTKNYRAAVRVTPPGRWKFFPHDTERAGYNALRNAGLNKDSTTKNDVYRPTYVHQELTANAEYRMRFADRAHRFLFNGGALTEGPAGSLWGSKADLIRDALKAESARWGDFVQDQRGAPAIQTLSQWQVLVDREMNVWFPQRPAIVTEQFRSRSLYPDIDAPVFSQHGGSVPEGFRLLFTNLGSDDMYYTTDGSDPRLSGGAINPGATNATSGNTALTIIEDSSPGWEYLDDGSDQGSSDIVAGQPGYDTSNWKHPDFAPPVAWKTGAARLGYNANQTTTVEFGPLNSNKYPTTYFRKSFNLTEAALVTNLLLEVERDDGVIVYLNGHEVVRDNVGDGLINFDDYASDGVGGAGETTFHPFTIDASYLLEGHNVLAFEVHQINGGSSDLSIDARLSGTKVADGSSVPISSQMTVKARSYDAATQTWSALTEADFTTGRPPLPGDLTISQLHYHPADPNTAEAAQPFVTDDSDFEFIEIMNISPDSLELSTLSFSAGLAFTFLEGTSLLPADGRILIAHNRAALEFRYADRLPLPIAGEYGSSSGLSNGGEQIVLTNGELTLIDFTYDDVAPWPEAADGEGYSLVLIAPASNPDLSDPINWRSSTQKGGFPGNGDDTTLAGFAATNGITDPFDDHDEDGIATVVEYATGTPFDFPFHPGPLALQLKPSPEENLVLEFSVAPGADDILLTPEISTDLASWQSSPEDFVYLGEKRHPDGRMVRRFRSNALSAGKLHQFFRLRALQR